MEGAEVIVFVHNIIITSGSFSSSIIPVKNKLVSGTVKFNHRKKKEVATLPERSQLLLMLNFSDVRLLRLIHIVSYGILHKGIEGQTASGRSKGGLAVQFGLNADIERTFERLLGLFAAFLA